LNTPDMSRQYIVFKIKSRTLQCLVDSGSVNSIMSYDLAKKLQLKLQPLNSDCPLISASGQRLQAIGKADVNIQIKGLLVPHKFTVVAGLFPDILVGTDFLSKNNAFINYADNTVTFHDGLIVLPLQGFNSVKNCATIGTTACVPGYSEAILPVKIPSTFKNTEVVLEPLINNLHPVLVGGSLTAVKNNIGYMRVLNFKPYPVVLRKNAKIASILYPNNINSITKLEAPTDSPEDSNEADGPSPKTLEKFVSEFKIDVNSKLAPNERHDLLKLLYKYKNIFA